MNGSPVGLFTVMGSQSVHDDDTIDNRIYDGTPVSILIILLEDNDSTIVDCVAFFPEQSSIKEHL